MVLQAPILEFCYQTAHLAPAGPRGQFLPVNKVTVLARTLQLSLLPSPSMSRLPSAAATGPRWSNKEGKEGMGSREQQASSLHDLAHRASGEGKGYFASWNPFCTRQWWCS